MRTPVLMLAALSLAPPSRSQVRLPRYTREVLPNGVVLELAPRKGVPLVSVLVIVRGGGESDPPQMAGLASITAELLRRGQQGRSAGQFSEALDSLGATFNAGSGPQATAISSEFMAKDATAALELLSDAVLRPAFPEAEVAKALAERIDSTRAMKDQPMAAASLYFRAFFFGPQHPYGRPPMGDELSLKRIDRAAIAACHARMYAGRNLVVVAAGDFEPDGLGAQLKKAFGAAPPGQRYEWQKDRTPGAGGPRLLLVDKPDATQTYFWIGAPGINRTHPDRVAVWLVNTLFGGRFTSMLNSELRVNSGLTYGASSRAEENRLTGAIAITSYTRTDATTKAIDLALDVLKRLRDQGINAEQLASVKAYVKGSFPSDRLETSDQVAAVLAELEVFSLDRSDIDTLFERIDAVTLEQANAAARAHFGAGDLVFTLVGNAAKIRDAVKKYAPQLVEIPITRPGFDIGK